MDSYPIQFHSDRADSLALRTAFSKFATGVTVITTRTPEGKMVGLTANSFSSVSLDPPMLLWSIGSGAPSFESFRQAGRFAVNVLSEDQQELSQHFSKPASNKFDGMNYIDGRNGCPVIPGALAIFECDVHRMVEAGDHHIVLGNVIRASVGDGQPLLFVAGRYSRLEGTRRELHAN